MKQITIFQAAAQAWGVTQADTYVDDIHTAFVGLAQGHRIGRTSDVRDGYWKYAVGKHVVYYRISETRLEVVRVLHQRMDVSSLFDL